MSAAESKPPDRPLLRLFNPELAADHWTIQKAFDEFRETELKQRSRNHQTEAAKFVRWWYEFEGVIATEHGDAQRTTYPLRVKDVGSQHLRAFQTWLKSRSISGSQVNKAVGEIRCIIDRAGEEGIEVQNIKMRRVETSSRPRFYMDDAAMAALWTACERMTWPDPTVKRVRSGHTFRGTGLPSCDWWRAILILLRTYGMRVQDLVAYESDADPIAWSTERSAVSLSDPRSPNLESLETWAGGWLFYCASKTGRQYYLPLMPHARAAFIKLREAAIARDGKLDPASPVLPCPKSHGLPDKWKELQELAGVATRRGTPYQLEDFRKTVAAYTATVDSELPYAVCGWGGGNIKTRHYQQPEPLLVAKLPLAPMPPAFDAWL